MRNKILIILLAALALVALDISPAVSQIVYGQPPAAGTHVVYSHWKLEQGGDEVTVNQFMIPLTGFVPLQDNFEMSFYIANSSNTLKAGSEFDLNGLGDARVQANHSFADDQLLVSVGLNLPTGKRELDAEEALLLDVLSTNFLDLPMRRFGEGFGFNILLGGAAVLSEGIRGGIGLSYQYTGTYTPYENLGDYNPGDVFSANVGADFDRGDITWSLDFIYSLYTTDQFDNINTFRQSPSFDSRLSGQWSGEKVTLSGLVRYVLRGDNKEYDTTGAELDAFKLYGNEFTVGGAVSYMFSPQWFVTPATDLHIVTKSNRGLDNATVFGIGASLGRTFQETVRVNGGFKIYTGNADGGNIDVTGYQITFDLTAAM